jgi:hypothetical protein
MTTRATFTKIAGLVILFGAAAGCATSATAKTPAAPPATSSTPTTPVTFTHPSGMACLSNQTVGGYCPGDAPSTPAPPASDSPFNAAIGETVTMTDDNSGAEWDVTMNSVHHFTQGQYEDAPHVGDHYIVINVTYSATAGSVDVNEWDWTAKSPDGTVNEVQYATSANEISATTIQTGSKIRGTVVLAIANGSSGTVVYSAGGSEQASWNFSAAQAG